MLCRDSKSVEAIILENSFESTTVCVLFTIILPQGTQGENRN